MSHYIAASTITDTVVSQFVTSGDTRLDTWLTRTDDEVDALAESCDVYPGNIVWSGSTPIGTMHPRITEYARAYFSLLVCEDNIGANNVDTSADEKYRVKASIYHDRLKELRGQITGEMFTGGDDDMDAVDLVGQDGLIWRS